MLLRQLFIVFFLLNSSLYAANATSPLDLHIAKEFSNYWSSKFSHMNKKGTFCDVEESFKSELVYNGYVIRIEASVKPHEWTVYLYDDNDPLLKENGVPFLAVGYEKAGEVESYLNDFGKTETFSGKELMALALHLKSFFNIKQFIIVDSSTTVQCPLDGVYCSQRSIMELRALGVNLTGYSYYESLGAKPRPQMKGYREAADFIKQLKISELESDMEALSHLRHVSELKKAFRRFRSVTAQKSPELTLGELAQGLKMVAAYNKESHEAWHDFHDLVIGNRHTSSSAYACWLSKRKWSENQSLVVGMTFIVYAHTRLVFNQLLYYAHAEKEKPHPDEAFLKEAKILLDHFPENLERARELTAIKSLEMLKQRMNSPSVFSLLSRADDRSILNYFKVYFPIEESSAEVYDNCVDALIFCLKKEGKTSTDYRSEFLKLYEMYTKDPRQLQPGNVYGMWLFAKWLVSVSDLFEFCKECEEVPPSTSTKWKTSPLDLQRENILNGSVIIPKQLQDSGI